MNASQPNELQSAQPDETSRFSLLLVTSRDGEHALLYVYCGGKFVRNAIGQRETLKNFAATNYAGVPLEEKVVDVLSEAAA